MAATDQYAGTIRVMNGRLILPEKYAAASQFVVRQRRITQVFPSGAGISSTSWKDNDEDPDWGDPQNPQLEPDEVTLKLYGEPEETYRVEVDDE